ncbi:MAG: HNH endonuclease [Actinobacteria bacterium]|nr:HNH endonuclease [Actinomycetota bacterium]
MRGRAYTQARKSGVPFDFIWVNMNYRAFVEPLRAMMTPAGLCPSCGHGFLGERDIQIEHREPPRHDQDWARLHRRNLDLACASCNRTKGRKPYAEWLDEQESTRLSNEADPHRGRDTTIEIDIPPPTLFDWEQEGL